MVVKTKRQAFLVEVPATSQFVSSQSIKLGRRKFAVEPLFSQKGALRRQANWLLLTPKTPSEGQNPWDWAHDLASKLQTVSSESAYVEPDIEQEVPYLNREGKKIDESACLQASDCSVNEPDPSWPNGPSFAWHLADEYSQLASARDVVGEQASSIRIGHIDTGIDPEHTSAPGNVNWSLSRNFVEGGSPVDPGKRGILYNPGHGTGTVGILAGNKIEVAHPHLNHVFSGYLGGCPHAEIVVVRAANSVVHLWTSSMAKSLEYVASPGDDENERPCDVVSISMGGLPSRAWSAAVNRCYENGVTVLCAAGNNFGGFPLRTLVWPARFARTIAVTGVTADKTPYYKRGLHFKMQSCYGPASAMFHAIAAYSPNVTWSELGCANTIDLDGAGTSSATPQAAAAAALWLAKYKDKVGSGWRKVEAVRHALFSSADKSLPESEKYYGNGVLRALDALGVKPLKAKKLVQSPPDDVNFPLLTKLSGWEELETARAQMYEVEACQLYASTAKLQDLYPELEDGITGDATVEDVVSNMCDLPNISLTLRSFLLASINK
jgi:Subtilisin-like serine proteases